MVGERTFHQFLKRHIKARKAWEMGRDEFNAGLKQLMWRKAKNSITMLIFLRKQWLGWKEKQQIGGDPGSLPIGLSIEHEAGLDALLLAAKAANKPAKDEKDGDR